MLYGHFYTEILMARYSICKGVSIALPKKKKFEIVKAQLPYLSVTSRVNDFTLL